MDLIHSHLNLSLNDMNDDIIRQIALINLGTYVKLSQVNKRFNYALRQIKSLVESKYKLRYTHHVCPPEEPELFDIIDKCDRPMGIYHHIKLLTGIKRLIYYDIMIHGHDANKSVFINFTIGENCVLQHLNYWSKYFHNFKIYINFTNRIRDKIIDRFALTDVNKNLSDKLPLWESYLDYNEIRYTIHSYINPSMYVNIIEKKLIHEHKVLFVIDTRKNIPYNGKNVIWMSVSIV